MRERVCTYVSEGVFVSVGEDMGVCGLRRRERERERERNSCLKTNLAREEK